MSPLALTVRASLAVPHMKEPLALHHPRAAPGIPGAACFPFRGTPAAA